MIYFDSAATSYYRPDCVAQAVARAIATVGNPFRGGYEASLSAGRLLLETRELLAELVHAEGPERVAFCANATMALNTALRGLLRPGDHLVTTVLEHNSVLRPAYRLEETGVRLHVAEADALGRLDCGDFEAQLARARREAVAGPAAENSSAVPRAAKPRILAAVTHASNVTGNVVDLAAVGGLCRKYGALLLADASQTVGSLPVDMEKDGIDLLCFSGHKGLMGPQGTGGLVVRRGVALRPLLEGGSGVQSFLRHMPEEMPASLEAGTQNAHGLAGLRAALLYNKGKTGEFYVRETALRLRLLAGLRELGRRLSPPGGENFLHVYGDCGAAPHAPVLSFNLGNEDSAWVADRLFEGYGIAVRPGAHCAPLMHRHFGTEKQGMVRVSFSPYNTEDQIDALLAALAEIAEEIL